VHASVLAAAVEVLLAGGGGRGEVASDKGFEDFVAGVGCYAAALGVAGEEGAGVVLYCQMTQRPTTQSKIRQNKEKQQQ